MRRIGALTLVAVIGIAVSALLVEAAKITPSSRFPGWTLTPVAALCGSPYYPGWFGECAPSRGDRNRQAALRH